MNYVETSPEEIEAIRKWEEDNKKNPNKYKQARNWPCPCGSGLKYKKCHYLIKEE